MTVIVPEQVRCPGCDQPVQVYVLISWSSFGFSDFRRVDRVRCPACGQEVTGDFIEFTDPDDPDAQLQADPRFTEEDPLDDGETTEITFGGEWIPGSRPKPE